MEVTGVGISTENQCRNRIGNCKVQGEHGIIPPDDRIVKAVEGWLDNLQLQDCEGEVLEYGLEIAGWKCFSGNEGVTLFRVRDYPFDKSLELRVRIHEERDFLWRCFLFCPTRERAWQIALYARTDAFNWISVFINRREELPSFQIKLSNRNVKRAYAHSKSRDKSEKEVVKLSRGRGLKRLCWAINNTYSIEKFISMEELIDLVKREIKVTLSRDSCYDLMKVLLDKGVLDPCKTDDDAGYRGTAILQERAFDYDNILREEEIKRLEARQESLNRQKSSAFSEVARLEKRLAQLKESLERLSLESDKTEEKIVELKAVITGSYNGEDE